MKIAVLKERRAGENRVAASPETVKKFTALGAEMVIEAGAGLAAGITDDAFAEVGAKIEKTMEATLKDATVVLKVQRPMNAADGGEDELSALPEGAVLVSTLNPHDHPGATKAYAARKIDAFAMELMPRITRAQSMDVLSSQSNLSGYRAVIDAAYHFGRAYPMMMTAAGTVAPAQVLVMGAGVAGLQAIATAKRLGAVVSATDVRPAAKEQVESLGGKFVAVEDEEFKQAETSGGYAKAMSEEYQKKQAELIAKTITKMDVVICTALIPGRAAPILLTEDHVKSMKPGSVIVDLAAERGGNCALTKSGKIIEKHGVTIVGSENTASLVAADASQLYARNLFNFLSPFIDKDSGALALNWEDEVVSGTGLTHDGEVVHPQFKEAAEAAELPTAAAPAKKPATKKPAAKKPATRKAPARKPAAKKEEAAAAPVEQKPEEAPAPAAPSSDDNNDTNA